MVTRGTSHARLGETAWFGSMRRFAALSVATLLGSVAFGSAAGSAGEPANAVRISRCSTRRHRRHSASAPTVA
jgi:hypothetical protein